MYIYRAYKFRLYPNDNQKELVNKTLGCSRFVYNYYLNKKQIQYKEHKTSDTSYNCIKYLLNLYIANPWLKEVD